MKKFYHIHLTKEAHEAAKKLSRKAKKDMKATVSVLILEAAKKLK